MIASYCFFFANENHNISVISNKYKSRARVGYIQLFFSWFVVFFFLIACIQAVMELNISVLAATWTVHWQIKSSASISCCSRTTNSPNFVSKAKIFLLNKRKTNCNLVLKQKENLKRNKFGGYTDELLWSSKVPMHVKSHSSMELNA